MKLVPVTGSSGKFPLVEGVTAPETRETMEYGNKYLRVKLYFLCNLDEEFTFNRGKARFFA